MDAPPLTLTLPTLRAKAAALVEMTKYRLSSLVVVTAGAGYVLGGSAAAEPVAFDGLRCALVLVGTTLAAFGANALNQCLEVERDRQMQRTRGRPLPSGRLSLLEGVSWGLLLLVLGVGGLTLLVSPLAAALAFLVAALYVGVYTPLKPRTSLNTLAGAVCGAVPPMIGWVARTGELEPGAWVLFAVLFVWQIPHFLAIDWYHQDDYEQGGFCMASSVDRSGGFSAHHAVLYSAALLPISVLAPLTGMGGWLYAAGALVLGTVFLGLSLAWMLRRTRLAARRLFLASLAYLPLLLALLVLDPTRP
ncbi:MAG: heme o synthase [Planctomycetota bacterium]